MTTALWPFGVMAAASGVAAAAYWWVKYDIARHPTLYHHTHESCMEDFGNLLDTGDIE